MVFLPQTQVTLVLLPQTQVTLVLLPQAQVTLVLLPQAQVTLVLLPQVQVTLVLLPQAQMTLVLLPQVQVTSCRFWLPCVCPLVILLPKFSFIWLSNLSILSVPDEGYFKSASCALNLISTFLFKCCIGISSYVRQEYCLIPIYIYIVVGSSLNSCLKCYL